MRRIHPLSFGLGVASGALVLLLIAGGMHMLQPQRGFGGGNGNGPNIARMAQRFGMTEDELRTEMATGKTMQEIATEHGVQMGGGFGRNQQGGNSSAMMPTGSGARMGSGSMMSSSPAAMMNSSASSSSSANR